jgi:hypothetical protein
MKLPYFKLIKVAIVEVFYDGPSCNFEQYYGPSEKRVGHLWPRKCLLINNGVRTSEVQEVRVTELFTDLVN